MHVYVYACLHFVHPQFSTDTHTHTHEHKLRDRKTLRDRQRDMGVIVHPHSHAVARTAYHLAKSGGQPEFRRRAPCTELTQLTY